MRIADSSGDFDLVLRHARVIDASQNLNRVLDVGIRNGKIAAIAEALPASGSAVEKSLRGKYLCPGLVDLHGHWYGGSTFGIDPDYGLKSGVTTAVDAGTTGFLNFGEFRRDRMANSRTQVLAFLNISAIGIPTALVGELRDLRYARPKETSATIERNSDVLLGVKIRIGTLTTGDHGMEALTKALEAAEAAKVSLMVHISKGANTPQILKRLRPGDIITHCFQGKGDTLLAEESMIPEALVARRDGVLFDVGHGSGSFSWETAKKAFEHFFLPDTISTDLHRFSVERAVYDMPTTMSKFLHLGMSLEDVIRKATWEPAKAIHRENDLGTLRPGTVADLFVFDVQDGAFEFEDSHSRIEIGSRKIKPELMVRAGTIVGPGARPVTLRPLYEWDHELFRYLDETAQS